MERIESLSPESKVSRFCMEAGFMRFVEVGQFSILGQYVVDSNQNNTEIPADLQEDQAPQTSIKVVAARSLEESH